MGGGQESRVRREREMKVRERVEIRKREGLEKEERQVLCFRIVHNWLLMNM